MIQDTALYYTITITVWEVIAFLCPPFWFDHQNSHRCSRSLVLGAEPGDSWILQTLISLYLGR